MIAKVICLECQTEAYATETHCPACGALLPHPCKGCGHPIPPREEWCSTCQAAMQVPVSPSETESADEEFICPTCHQPILISQAMAVCPVCRTRQHHACWDRRQGCGMPGCTGSWEILPVEERESRCHQCGEPLREGAAVCLHCGAPTRQEGSGTVTFAFTAAEAGIALGSLLALLGLLLPWHPYTDPALTLAMWVPFAVLTGLSVAFLLLSWLAPRRRVVLARGQLGLAVMLLLTVTWAWARVDAETVRLLAGQLMEREGGETWPRLAPSAGLWLALVGSLLLVWGGTRRAHLTHSRRLPVLTTLACLGLVLFSALFPRSTYVQKIQPLFGLGRVREVHPATPAPPEAEPEEAPVDGDFLLQESRPYSPPPEIVVALQDFLRRNQSEVELIGTVEGPSPQRPYRAFAFSWLGFLEVYDYHAAPRLWKRNTDLSGAETHRSRPLQRRLR